MKKIKYLIRRVFAMDYKSMWNTIKKVHKRSGKGYLAIIIDMFSCAMKYQAGYTDYFLFNFEALNDKQRSTFITRGINNAYLLKMNDSSYYHCFSDKVEFNKIFKDYLMRDFLDLKEADADEFVSFMKKHPKVMAKPVDESGGKGVTKIEVDEDTDLKALYEQLKAENKTLVEEYVKQHPKMNELCPSSVNTLRIVTATKNNQTAILVRVIRMGNGINDVDNLHKGGLFTFFNEEGVINKPAIDREGNVFTVHPTSGVKIEGFEIPYYKEAIAMAKKAAKVIPQVGLIGFDVAITENGPCLIEGNELPGYDLYQSKIHLSENNEGLKPLFDKVIYGEIHED